MTTLVFNPQSKDYFKAKACVAISKRYNYAGSNRSYRFEYLSFNNWCSSYRAAFCYILSCLESASKSGVLSFPEINILLNGDTTSRIQRLYVIMEQMKPFFSVYSPVFSPVEKLSFVYRLLDVLIRFNLGDIRFDLVSPMFGQKSAIRYAASKYFPNIPFIEIESDFMFVDVMD